MLGWRATRNFASSILLFAEMRNRRPKRESAFLRPPGKEAEYQTLAEALLPWSGGVSILPSISLKLEIVRDLSRSKVI